MLKPVGWTMCFLLMTLVLVHNPVYYYVHIMYYRCIWCNWNQLFLRDIYIPRVGVALTSCRDIAKLSFFPAWFQLCISISYIILYMDIYTMWVTLCIGQLYPITVHKTVFLCAVPALSVIMCSFYEFLDSVTNKIRVSFLGNHPTFCIISTVKE